MAIHISELNQLFLCPYPVNKDHILLMKVINNPFLFYSFWTYSILFEGEEINVSILEKVLGLEELRNKHVPIDSCVFLFISGLVCCRRKVWFGLNIVLHFIIWLKFGKLFSSFRSLLKLLVSRYVLKVSLSHGFTIFSFEMYADTI